MHPSNHSGSPSDNMCFRPSVTQNRIFTCLRFNRYLAYLYCEWNSFLANLAKINVNPSIRAIFIIRIIHFQAGPLQSVKIPFDRETKRQKPFAFVLFQHPESVSYAVDLFKDVTLFGRPIRLQNKETGAGMNDTRGPQMNGHSRGHHRSFSAPDFQNTPNHGYPHPPNSPYNYPTPPGPPVRESSYNNGHSFHHRERSSSRNDYGDYYRRDDRSHYHQQHQYQPQYHQSRSYEDRRPRERSYDRSRDYDRRDHRGSSRESGGGYHRRWRFKTWLYYVDLARLHSGIVGVQIKIRRLIKCSSSWPCKNLRPCLFQVRRSSVSLILYAFGDLLVCNDLFASSGHNW